jgi:hypothetical protein
MLAVPPCCRVPAVVTCPSRWMPFASRMLLLLAVPYCCRVPAMVTCPSRWMPPASRCRSVHQCSWIQMRQARVAYNPPASRPPSRRNGDRSDRRRDKSTRTRSTSPTQAGPTRGRYRSYSPPTRDNAFTSRRGETRARDNGKRAKGDKGHFFRPGADSRGGVCATCLGRHEHNYGKCDARKLWNGSTAASKKSGLGRLVGEDGLPICYDWQLPVGCQSTMHSERHRCSGCGKASHGAQYCPQAEKE